MSDNGPLHGVTVIDMTRVLAGPYATMVLADLGATVIKVEMPGYGDDARHFGPFVNEKSAYFSSLNRGKKSIALNLKDNEDREIFLNLLESADILVENYRAGTMEKLSLGWDVLHEKFPKLIYSAVSGFGHTGPYSDRPAYDMVVQAMGGLMSVTGHPDSGPTRVGTSIGDITAGLFGLSGILTALYDRNRTGVGIKVDVGMLDCQIAILENAIARYFASGEIPQPLGSRHPSITPFDAFSSADDYIIIAAGNDQLFLKLCETIDSPELVNDERFKTNVDRSENNGPLKIAIEEKLKLKSAEAWLSELGSAGIPCGPINNVAQAVNDAHVRERNMIIKTNDPVSGELSMAGNPIKLSGYSDPRERSPAPELDGDREEILSGLK
jgi:CoA:oxalate CoA-transferase